MNEEILKTIIENKAKFIPFLFTEKQVKLIEKHLQNMKTEKNEEKQNMTPTEKTILYSTIKKKVDALMLLKEEFYIKGQDMIPERVNKAKEILAKLKKEKSADKAFISGTFLFAKDYNDIDIYIISTKRKQFHKQADSSINKDAQDKELHFIHITEDDLRKPIFNSASQYCVANYFVETPAALIRRPTYNDMVMTYEGAINEALDNDDQKTIRELLFYYELLINKNVLNAFLLYKKFASVKQLPIKEKIAYVNLMTKEILLREYSLTYIYNELVKFIRRLKLLAREYPKHRNLPIYIKLFEEVKHGCRTT